MVKAARPPIIASTGDDLDLVVGVEALDAELGVRVPAIEFKGKVYRIWKRVEHFSETGGDRKVYCGPSIRKKSVSATRRAG